MTLGPDGLHALLAAALPREGLTVDDVATSCLGPGCDVLGDEPGAVVVKFEDWGGYSAAWIIAVAVDPGLQRRGRGRALVEDALAWARERGAHEMHLGTAIPRYLWPGVDFAFTGALCLFEATGFETSGVAYDMSIPTTFDADVPAGVSGGSR